MIDDSRIYLSGRGRIRAVNRRTGDVEWKADDIGNAAEMALVRNTLFVRTGGQFTRLKDGEQEAKGPYGLAAIDVTNGEVLWRYKGADKGLTNFVIANASTLLLADRDDLISIDAKSGSFPHSSKPHFFIKLTLAVFFSSSMPKSTCLPSRGASSIA